MSRARTSGFLVRCYPPAWRARYGEELEELIVASSGGGRVPLRTRLDVASAGVRERLRAAGLGDSGAAADRARAGALVVLCAWALCVVAGAGVQKASEHWQDVTPAASRELPATAFDMLVVAALCASVLVAAGIAVTLPSLAAFLHGGGWPAIRRQVVRAGLVTAAALMATALLVVWAHGLTGPQRSGEDTAYSVAFVAWALVLVGCLGAWTAVAVATARRLRLSVAILALQTRLACTVAAAMGMITAATAVWWVALAGAAPWFLAGRPVGAAGSPLTPQLVAIVALMTLMTLATVLGAAGASRAVRALPALTNQSVS